MASASLPKIVWMLWLQGWETAPAVVQACKASWLRHNPDWAVRALDRTTLSAALPLDVIADIFSTTKPQEALSDQIRLELLRGHGGVWADATTLCARPLDEWLSCGLPSGFFAFERPGGDRMIASWFLASARGSYITHAWADRVRAYWRGRSERDDYFWLHHLFAALYHDDARFKSDWDTAPKSPAAHPFHFSPEDARLYGEPTAQHLAGLANPPAPVFKLTHKLSQCPGPESLAALLCRFGHGAP